MKKFINKILDVPKLIRTIWIILWLVLIILLIFKFCFNLWYPVVSKNETFNNVCNYIDTHTWLNYSLNALFYLINFNISYLTCRGLKKYPKWYLLIIASIVAIGISLLKQYSNISGVLIEIILLLILPIILNIKNNTFKNNWINVLIPIMFYGLVNLWQFTMLVVRGTDGLILSELSSLIYLILQIDYYIFITITWIGVSYMGALGIGWFWSRDITVLKAEKEKELAKAKPNMKKIDSINIRIAELEKEGK